mmetsp:Transcript_31979/g.72992  ORF Transcript_31979/g.72992 Transcript_31979/m.72992 type:complete len:337 (-) Transcript_31979:336-1346(-)
MCLTAPLHVSCKVGHCNQCLHLPHAISCCMKGIACGAGRIKPFLQLFSGNMQLRELHVEQSLTFLPAHFSEDTSGFTQCLKCLLPSPRCKVDFTPEELCKAVVPLLSLLLLVKCLLQCDSFQSLTVLACLQLQLGFGMQDHRLLTFQAELSSNTLCVQECLFSLTELTSFGIKAGYACLQPHPCFVITRTFSNQQCCTEEIYSSNFILSEQVEGGPHLQHTLLTTLMSKPGQRLLAHVDGLRKLTHETEHLAEHAKSCKLRLLIGHCCLEVAQRILSQLLGLIRRASLEVPAGHVRQQDGCLSSGLHFIADVQCHKSNIGALLVLASKCVSSCQGM